MVKFKINEKEYELKDYISIEDYSNIFKVKDLFTDQYFAAKVVNLITGCPVEDLLKSDYEQVNYLATYIVSLVPVDQEIPFVDRFEIDGVHYGFFPNWRDLTFAEFIDIDTISTKEPHELLNMLHILAAIMFRPIEHEISEHNFLIEEYDVKTMIKRSEIFKKKLNVRYVLGAQRFFTKLEKRFSLYTRASLIQKISWTKKIQLLWKMRKVMWSTLFKKRTGGTLSSIELLEMILQNTTTSIKKT
ncbi:hypothetical protein UFOVP187_39 [uncultured Caudovirales phage]|uniref:Uncharacterized protein n=1 Tax=uncultured Caudovirales phage TaxID=2100421 RepID=A0A6J7WF25_9CAUD|nr:hypothetical protein UFOVP187_39 [uncultured Caudovirales phage]